MNRPREAFPSAETGFFPRSISEDATCLGAPNGIILFNEWRADIAERYKTRVIVSQLSVKRPFNFREGFFLKAAAGRTPCLEHQFGGRLAAKNGEARSRQPSPERYFYRL